MGCGSSKTVQHAIDDMSIEASHTADAEPIVAPAPVSARITEENEDDVIRLREKCPRFRILIIGKANAGKTTILQKMCNTTEAPVIHNQHGDLVDPLAIQPTDGRGIHDINSELTFSGNTGFVFHDSPGFEAASVKELETVRKFISERAASNELKDQLHAIWFCLPTDSARPLCDAEMEFFKQGTGKTPVIAIFTKYDGMILEEYNRLRYEEHCSREDSRDQAPKCADKLFNESKYYLKRLQASPHPPARSLRVQGLHKPESSCAELSRQTLEALDNKILQQIFVSVQQNNIGLCTEFAIKEFILNAIRDAGTNPFLPTDRENMVHWVLSCYGYLLNRADYDTPDNHLIGRNLPYSPGSLGHNNASGYGDLRTHRLIGSGHAAFLKTLQPAWPNWVDVGPASLQVLYLAIATLIIVEDSFWLKKNQVSAVEALKLALDQYESTATHSLVKNEIKERFNGASIQDLVINQKDVLVKMVMGIVGKFKTQI